MFTDRTGKTIFNPAKVPIIRHVKIRKGCNPYDRDWEEYVEIRIQRLARETMSRKAISLWTRQKGVCPRCKGDLDVEHQHIHHIVYRCHGGKDTLDNLWLMHDVCHRQLHAHSRDETEAGDSVEESLMKA